MPCWPTSRNCIPTSTCTIGALIGHKAAPDRERDCLAEWEERLAFEQKYRGEKDETAMRTLHIVTLFQRLDAPSQLVA